MAEWEFVLESFFLQVPVRSPRQWSPGRASGASLIFYMNNGFTDDMLKANFGFRQQEL